MADRTMFRADADENTIAVRTVSAEMKSQRFLITYTELDQLRSDGRIISSDIHSFAKIRLDEKHDRIVFCFTWLVGHCHGRVEGTEQTVTLPWSKFREFLDACRQPDGQKTYRALSQDTRRRPRLIFAGNRANLRAAVADRRIRRKLGKALMQNFNWPAADEIRLYNDLPYSFFFQEYSDGKPCICGGLIFHNHDGNVRKAYYGLHT